MKGLLAGAVVALALAACDRSHLSPTFGMAEREALSHQVIRPKAPDNPPPDQGLDPEEASIVSDGYRASLVPAKKETTNRAPLLFINQDAPKAGASAQPYGSGYR